MKKCVDFYNKNKPHSLPLKRKNMGDLKENGMSIVNSVSYLRGIKGEDSVLIYPSSLLGYYGIIRVSKKFEAGEEIEIDNRYGGIVTIRVSSYSNTIGMAIMNSDLSVKVVSEFPSGNFGSKIEGKVCIYRKVINGNMYLYNGTGNAHNINCCFISVA